MSRIRALIALIACSLLFAGGEPASAGIFSADFEVNMTGDEVDPIINGVCDVDVFSSPQECTLRAAIMESNANGDAFATEITFDIPGAGVHTITPATSLPTITHPTFIDGYTQTGSSQNTNGIDSGLNTVLTIAIEGSNMADDVARLLRVESDSVTIRGLAIQGNPDAQREAISVEGDNIKLLGNFIGTTVAGDAGYAGAGGVQVFTGSNASIGGQQPGERNLISPASGTSLRFSSGAADAVVEGNLFGTDKAGMTAIGNDIGIQFSDSVTGTELGGNEPEARNIISGNTIAGVLFNGAGATLNHVGGNYIGVGIDGTTPVPNEIGIVIRGSSQNQIGELTNAGSGPCDNGCNVISGNNSDGILIEEFVTDIPNGNGIRGNLIGTDATGATPVGNGGAGVNLGAGATGTLIGSSAGLGNVIANNAGPGVLLQSAAGLYNEIEINSIHDNGGLGIDLAKTGTSEDGVTPNDDLDDDTGANDLMNFPIITSAEGGTTNVHATLDSVLNGTFHIEVYSNTECDPSRHGEGETPIGSNTGTVGAGGHGEFDITTSQPLVIGSFLTATTTDLPGSTSEFSLCFEVTDPDATPTPTAAPTVTPEPTITPVPTATGQPTYPWGDLLCDGEVDTDDVTAGLAFLGEAEGGPEPEDGCPAIGETWLVAPLAGEQLVWGDIDCDGEVEAEDSLSLLLTLADLEQLPRELDCPSVGAFVIFFPAP